MDRGYGKSHVWVEGGQAGISQHAANELGNKIVYVTIDPGVYKKGDVFGTIESVKTVTDLIAPCDMTVVEINPSIETDPGFLDNDAEETPVAFVNNVNTDQLMTREEYLIWLQFQN